jgi:hypothetical protein
MTTKTRNRNKIKKAALKKNNYTRKQKEGFTKQVYDLSDQDVLADFMKLVEIGCGRHAALSTVGNDVVNKYTAVERLNTSGYQNISFYDVLFNKSQLKRENYVKKLMSFYKKNRKGYPEIKVMFRLSNLYFSSVSIFKPLIAMDVYCRFQPKTVLDFTMGWGGRLVGACALNIPKYIGIDSNRQLRTPYNKMCNFLKKHSTTDIKLYFQDALSIDYSKFDYDMVLTSPPYYNIEIYDGGNVHTTKEEWDEQFYKPIFEKTYKHLKPGGYYCLNIPEEVYENVAVKILGKPKFKMLLPKAKRSSVEKYHEYIYIWNKS